MKNKEKINILTKEEIFNKIPEVFSSIPFQKILKIAKDIQIKLSTDQTLAKKTKGEDELGWVTKADIEIQKFILNYFALSSLSGTYKITAEENFVEEKSERDAIWRLVVDPLDGTSEFQKDGDRWGVMVGACDENRVLKYSWNLLSTGEIYSSNNIEKKIRRKSFREEINKGEKITIDVYDYGREGTQERFAKSFQKIFNLENYTCDQTSYPSAVWAGGQLASGKLDGLLWLPSELGKKWYPDYDLIFLGALFCQGLKIRLGKIDGNNALIAIAPSDADVERLYSVGLLMLSDDQRNILIKAENELQIAKQLLVK